MKKLFLKIQIAYYSMMINLRVFTLWTSYRVFGVRHSEHKRKLPRKGDLIYACHPRPKRKIVARVSVREDLIEYTDGHVESIKNCFWDFDGDRRDEKTASRKLHRLL